jgi:hypothetical protein
MPKIRDLSAFVQMVHEYTNEATKRATGHYGGIVGDLRDIVPRQDHGSDHAPTARQDHARQYRARKSDSDPPTLGESPRQSRKSQKSLLKVARESESRKSIVARESFAFLKVDSRSKVEKVDRVAKVESRVRVV